MDPSGDRRPGESGWVCFYDGDCSFCVRTARLLSRLDLLSQVTWTPFQSLSQPPEGLSWDDLRSAAYVVTPAGRRYRGYYAFRRLTLKLPPLMPLAPLLWLPGVNLVGVALYRVIARRRHCF